MFSILCVYFSLKEIKKKWIPFWITIYFMKILLVNFIYFLLAEF